MADLFLDPTIRDITELQVIAKQHKVHDDVTKKIELCLHNFKVRNDYCETLSSPASEHVRDLIEKTCNQPWEKLSRDNASYPLSSSILTGGFEGNFLKMLVSMSKAKQVLELGLFTGCSALSIAECLPVDGSITSCEHLPYLQDLARGYLDQSPHGKKVIIKGGQALGSLEEMAATGQQFDIIFMDADKTNNIQYFELIMDKELLSPKGTILVDNALFYGTPYRQDHPSELFLSLGRDVHKFNEFVSRDERVYQVLVPIRDGVLMIRRKSDVDGSHQ